MMNQRGVIGLPLRLTIAFIIVLMCVPMLAIAANHFRENAEIQEMKSDVDSIIQNVDDLYFASAESSCTISVAAEQRYVSVGTALTLNQVCICKGDTVKDRPYAENPPVRPIGGVASIIGHSDICIECIKKTTCTGSG